MADWVPGAIGMSVSSYGVLSSARESRAAARAHDIAGRSMKSRWHIYPEHAAAGVSTTPTDLAKFMIEVQLSLAGRSTRVLARSTIQEMVTPVGVGPYAVGLLISQKGQGWYFEHGGGNGAFIASVAGEGFGAVVMTYGDNGAPRARGDSPHWPRMCVGYAQQTSLAIAGRVELRADRREQKWHSSGNGGGMAYL